MSDGFVLGIDIGGTKVALATARPDGHILARARIDADADRGAEDLLDRTIAAARTLLTDSAGRPLAVGAVCPGIVRPDGILLSPNIPGADRLRIVERLRAGLGIAAVSAGNDVKAAGLAEARWGALREVGTGLFLSLGTGIAAAIVHNGHVVGGAHGAAGEFGYNLRGVDDRHGARDGHTPLEEAVGGRGIAERAAAALGAPVTAADLFARTDPAARSLVDAVLDELAVHVANLAVAVDPDRVAVGGGLIGDPDRVLAALRRRLDQAVPFPPDLVVAHYPHESALIGALALAADQLAG